MLCSLESDYLEPPGVSTFRLSSIKGLYAERIVHIRSEVAPPIAGT